MAQGPPDETKPRQIKTVDNASSNNEASTVLTLDGTSYILPFPNGLSISSEYNWESEDLGTLGQEVYRGNLSYDKGVTSQVARRSFDGASAFIKQGSLDLVVDNLGKASFAADRKVLNPKKEVLFSGVTHRAFTLDWDFSPLNAGESEASYDFIKELHVAAAPSITSDSIFLTYPHTASLIVQDGGVAVLNRKQCAITAINCNLTPDNLWAVFKNGKPVHIALSVSFLELQLPTKSNARALFGG